MNSYFLTCTYYYKAGCLTGQREMVIQFSPIVNQNDYEAMRKHVLGLIQDRHSDARGLEIHCLSKL